MNEGMKVCRYCMYTCIHSDAASWDMVMKMRTAPINYGSIIELVMDGLCYLLWYRDEYAVTGTQFKLRILWELHVGYKYVYVCTSSTDSEV